MALRRVWIGSPNYSSRGSAVRLVVLHTAEGATNYRDLGRFFANPASGVSSHVGIDDTPGEIGEYVTPDKKAWTQGNANPYSVAAELTGFAAWTAADWAAHSVMVANAAQWVAEECARFGIPLRALNAAQAQGGEAGVCDHAALGAAGGGHWDIGHGLSVQSVVDLAKGGTAPAPDIEGGNMIAALPDGRSYYTCTRDGAVYAFGPAATYRGNAMKDLPKGRTIVGIAADEKGYRLLSSAGDLYCYGSDFYGKPDRV